MKEFKTKEAVHLYIIRAGSNPKAPIKVGIAHNIQQRLRSLQSGNPNKLEVLTCITMNTRREAESLEQHIHRRLKHCRMASEWFNVNKMGGALKAALKEYEGITGEPLKRRRVRGHSDSMLGLDRRVQQLKEENSSLRSKLAEQDAYIEELHDQIALLESPL